MKLYVFTGILIFSIGLFSVAILVALGLNANVGFKNEVTEPSFKNQDFRSTQYNLLSETTSRGFAFLPSERMEGDFISYFDEDGNSNLISRFGMNDYRCTGKCFCEESKRRISTTASTKGVFFLIAAVSSLLAIEVASDYLEDECKQQLLDTCSSETSIGSEVDDCGDLEPSAEYYEYVKKMEEEEEEEVLDDDEDYTMFWCHGHCLPKNFKVDDPDRELAVEHGCEKMVIEHEIAVEDWEVNDTTQSSHQIARSKFRRGFMTEFCKMAGLKEIKYIGPSQNCIKKEVYLCTATNLQSKRKEKGEKGGGNLSCRQMKRIQ